MKGRMLVVLVALALGGCATWSPETKWEEGAYQVLNAADYVQTRQIVSCPATYYEIDSAWAVGRHPDQRSVTGMFAVQALGHAGGTALLAQAGAPAWVQRTWQAVTLGVEARDVGRNWRLGLRFGGTKGCDTHNDGDNKVLAPRPERH